MLTTAETPCTPETPFLREGVTDLILAEEEYLRRLARRLTRCEADADDLVQSTLLRAYRARENFQPGTSIRAWTATILRRVFLTDVIQSRRRRIENDTDAGELLDRSPGSPWSSIDAHPSIQRLLEGVDDDVKRAIERVPREFLVPFLLSVVEDLSCAEIAARLGVPEGTVMSRIYRARERVKRDLVYGRVARPALTLSRRRPTVAA